MPRQPGNASPVEGYSLYTPGPELLIQMLRNDPMKYES